MAGKDYPCKILHALPRENVRQARVYRLRGNVLLRQNAYVLLRMRTRVSAIVRDCSYTRVSTRVSNTVLRGRAAETARNVVLAHYA